MGQTDQKNTLELWFENIYFTEGATREQIDTTDTLECHL